jgi:hypothetical protein
LLVAFPSSFRPAFRILGVIKSTLSVGVTVFQSVWPSTAAFHKVGEALLPSPKVDVKSSLGETEQWVENKEINFFNFKRPHKITNTQ